MKDNSPIMQILYSESGTRREIPLSEEYHRRLKIVAELDKALHEKLSAFPELDSLYDKTDEALEFMHLQEADDCYKEAFRFGFLLALDLMGYEKREVR